MSSLRTAGGFAVAAAIALAWPAAANAQMPTGTIKIIVPYAAGGPPDVVIRKLSQRIQAGGGPTFVVENKSGGGQVPAALEVKQAAPDGRTLLLTDLPTFAINVTLMPDLPYDPVKDFKPITTIFTFPSLLVVPQSTPARTMKELEALAKKTPGGLPYASQGVGSGGQLLSEMFSKASGAPLIHVPYRGSALAYPDVVSGKVAFIFGSYAGALPFFEKQQLIPVAVASKKRLKLLPNTPTTGEAGYSETDLEFWYGLAAPAGTPDFVIAAIRAAFVKEITAPDMVADLDGRGLNMLTTTPEEFATLIKTDIVRLRPAVISSGAKPN